MFSLVENSYYNTKVSIDISVIINPTIMKIISDSTDLILLDEESGRFFRVNKVPYTPSLSYCYGRKLSNYDDSNKQSATSNTNRPIESYEAGYIFSIDDGPKRDIILNGQVVYTNRKYGYALNDGTVKIKPIYDMLYFCGDKIKARICINRNESVSGFLDRSTGCKDLNCKPPIFTFLSKLKVLSDIDLVTPYSYGFAICVRNKKLGVISSSLEVVIPMVYDSINNNNWSFHSPFCFNTYDSEYRGVVNLTYTDDKGLKHKEFAIFRNNSVVKIITKNIDSMHLVNKGFGYKARKDDLLGLYNIDGEELLPLSFSSISDITANIICVTNNEKTALYKIEDNKIVLKTDFLYEWVDGDYQNINQYGISVCVLCNGRYMFLNNDFEVVDIINHHFSENIRIIASTYGDGLVGCEGKNSYYFLNMNGEKYAGTEKLRLWNIERGFYKGLAVVDLWDYHDINGYYRATINKNGEITDKHYIECEMVERGSSDDIENDISDAFDGLADAYWNID